MYNYDELKELGDESAVKSAGKIMTKGKDYVVKDGDIICKCSQIHNLLPLQSYPANKACLITTPRPGRL